MCIPVVLGLLSGGIQVNITEHILLVLTSCKLVYTVITSTAERSIRWYKNKTNHTLNKQHYYAIILTGNITCLPSVHNSKNKKAQKRKLVRTFTELK